ncbi:MAG: hypothetical protein Kow0037_11390 [Calditrichia bacterium]
MKPFEVLIPITIFLVFAYIIRIIMENRVRTKLIEKGLVDESIKHLFQAQQKSQPDSSLKWGLVLVGVGAAFAIGGFFREVISEEVTMGMAFVFAGIAYLVYYFKAERNRQAQ